VGLTLLMWKCGKRSNLLNTTGSSQKNPPGFGLDEGSSKNLLSNHLKFLAVAKPLKMILPSNIAPAVGAVSSPSSALGGLLIFWGGAGGRAGAAGSRSFLPSADAAHKNRLPGAQARAGKEPDAIPKYDRVATVSGSRPIRHWWTFLPRTKTWSRVLCPRQW
jgi:hypothetical protein